MVLFDLVLLLDLEIDFELCLAIDFVGYVDLELYLWFWNLCSTEETPEEGVPGYRLLVRLIGFKFLDTFSFFFSFKYSLFLLTITSIFFFFI